MSEFEGFDMDRSVARAWTDFQGRLADRLVSMTDPDTLVIEVLSPDQPEDGATPYVQFAGFGGDHLRGEVVGNKYLAADYQLDAARERVLVEQGWEPPEDENFYVHMPAEQGDRMAVMAIRALRDVFDVPHPAFLRAMSDDAAISLGLEPAPQGVDDEGPEPLAITPESSEHLRQLVDAALTSVFGHTPFRDEDGDIPVPCNTALLFIRVVEDEPIVELFSNVVSEITDAEAARVEVGILNRDYKFVKFVAHEDRVFAHIQIPSYPFVPQVLRAMLKVMSKTLDEVDDDLAVRTGGRRALEPKDDVEELEELESFDPWHPVLTMLFELDASRVDDLAPEEVAEICRHDRDLVHDLLQVTTSAEISWRASHEAALFAGDTDEADQHATELAAWERATVMLRGALRVIARPER